MPKTKNKSKAKKPNKPAAKPRKPSTSQATLKPASTGSKSAIVAELLERSGGVSISELASKTGWQPHTCRAMISGLRKAGHKIETSPSKGGKNVYRIVGTKKRTVKAGR